MADFHVAAHAAAINDTCVVSSQTPFETPTVQKRLSDAFSMLLTSCTVALAQQRRHEAAPHDQLLKHHADVAWAAVCRHADRLFEAASSDDEDQAFVAMTLVINRLASLRGTQAGAAFCAELMADPIDLIGLFRHARSHRSERLMAATFNVIDNLGGLKAFGARRAQETLGAAAA